MFADNLRLLFLLYRRPARAQSGILDEGSLLFALGAVLLVSLLSSAVSAIPMFASLALPGAGEASLESQRGTLNTQALALRITQAYLATSVFGALFTLAALYVPGCILAATFIAPVGSFGVAFRRDYGSLLVCALFSWAAAHLPFALLGLGLGVVDASLWPVALGSWLAGTLAFAFFMIVALRTVFGLTPGEAAATAVLGALALALLPVAPMLASPFLLYWLWQYFRGDVSDIQWSFGRRQSFKRHLQAATLNPRDAEAHYQLGLIYQHRRQVPEATERFRTAIEIDPGEVDAHYQLGRIARSEKRLPEAIRHFEEVVKREPTHSRHEVWREIGATYAESGDAPHARWALEKFVAARPHDPEGLCRFGEAQAAAGDGPGAREQFQRAVEAADTMPAYRRREVSEWRRRARRQLP
jgi:tetratricopeptide (TPR) repeat protein